MSEVKDLSALHRAIAERLEPEPFPGKPLAIDDWKYNHEGDKESESGLWRSHYSDGVLILEPAEFSEDGNAMLALIEAMHNRSKNFGAIWIQTIAEDGYYCGFASVTDGPYSTLPLAVTLAAARALGVEAW